MRDLSERTEKRRKGLDIEKEKRRRKAAEKRIRVLRFYPREKGEEMSRERNMLDFPLPTCSFIID